MRSKREKNTIIVKSILKTIINKFNLKSVFNAAASLSFFLPLSDKLQLDISSVLND